MNSNSKRLNKMTIKIQFDREVTEEHNLMPGGYGVNDKNFDFYDVQEQPVDGHADTRLFICTDCDNEVMDGQYVITPDDLKEKFNEFFVYTGERGCDPEIHPLRVTEATFEFVDEVGCTENYTADEDMLARINTVLSDGYPVPETTTVEMDNPCYHCYTGAIGECKLAKCPHADKLWAKHLTEDVLKLEVPNTVCEECLWFEYHKCRMGKIHFGGSRPLCDSAKIVLSDSEYYKGAVGRKEWSL